MLGTREGKYRWALHFDKYTSVTILSRHLLHDAMEQQGKPLAKIRTRRFKANARERHRMHALNSALDRLRSCMPVQCKSHKLSKIETLRLARNYIFALSSVVQGTNDPLVFARTLTQGISQSTCNLIANSLNASLRNLHLHDNTASNDDQQNLFSNWSAKSDQSALFLAENPLDTFMNDWS